MALKIDGWNLIPLLEDVDSELPAGTHIEIVVVGGAVMVLKRTYRFTYDVDSITVIPPLLAAAAERVADRHGLSSDWPRRFGGNYQASQPSVVDHNAVRR